MERRFYGNFLSESTEHIEGRFLIIFCNNNQGRIIANIFNIGYDKFVIRFNFNYISEITNDINITKIKLSGLINAFSGEEHKFEANGILNLTNKTFNGNYNNYHPNDNGMFSSKLESEINKEDFSELEPNGYFSENEFSCNIM